MKSTIKVLLIFFSIITTFAQKKNPPIILTPSIIQQEACAFFQSSNSSNTNCFVNDFSFSTSTNGTYDFSGQASTNYGYLSTMRLSNFSAHKTLLILCSNGKDRNEVC